VATDIYALLHRLRDLEQRSLDANSRVDELRAARNALKANPPEALRRRDTDHPRFCIVEQVAFYTHSEVVNVRRFRADAALDESETPQLLDFASRIMAAWNLQTDAVSPIRIRPGDLERADEIIAGWEAWEKELLERSRTVPITDAETLVNHLDEQILQVRSLIKAYPENTLPVLAIKARIAAEWNDGDWFDEVADALEALAAAA